MAVATVILECEKLKAAARARWWSTSPGLALTDDDRRRLRIRRRAAVILFAQQLRDARSSCWRSPRKSRACANPNCRSASTTKAGACSASRRASPRFRRCASLGVLWDRDREAGGARGARGRHRHRRRARRARRRFQLHAGARPRLRRERGDRRPRVPLRPDRGRRARRAAHRRASPAAGMAAVGKHFPGHGFAARRLARRRADGRQDRRRRSSGRTWCRTRPRSRPGSRR